MLLGQRCACLLHASSSDKGIFQQSGVHLPPGSIPDMLRGFPLLRQLVLQRPGCLLLIFPKLLYAANSMSTSH